MRRLIFTTAVLLLGSPDRAGAKSTVCTATINSSEEREIFRRRLDPAQFDFVELTDFGLPADGATTWFENACAAGVACDVLIVSGHFAGTFFGNRGFSLDVRQLERRACASTCPGVLNRPREVYLFGCNTLAGKNADARTPGEYLRILIGDGLARDEAERIVAARYGPFGSSYRDRIERAFEGVARIYGFDSVGPSGANVARALDGYLTRLGDYRGHLERASGAGARASWLAAMASFNRAVGAGLSRGDPLYEVRENTCRLNDSERPVHERLGVMADLLDRDPVLYLPTIASFARENLGLATYGSLEADRDVAATLGQLRLRRDLAGTFARVSDAVGVTPSLRVDLLSAARHVGWLTPGEFDAAVGALFAGFSKKPDLAAAEFICAQIDANPDLARLVNAEHLRAYAFDSAAPFRVVGCARAGADVTAAAVAGYFNNASRLRKLELGEQIWIIYAMHRMFGDPWGRARVLRAYLNFTGAREDEVRRLVRTKLIELTRGPEQVALVRKLTAGSSHARDLEEVWRALAVNPEKEDEAVMLALEPWLTRDGATFGEMASAPIGLVPNSREVQNALAARLGDSERSGVLAFAMQDLPGVISEALREAMIAWLGRVTRAKAVTTAANNIQAAAFVLSRSDLSVDEVRRVISIYRRAHASHQPYLRYLISETARGRVDLDPAISAGLKMVSRCTARPEGGWTCGFSTIY